MDKREVIVYSTPTCIYCDKVMELLDSKNLKYKIVDISESDETLQKFLEITGQMSVPVLEVDGKFIVGYKEKEIKKLIEEM